MKKIIFVLAICIISISSKASDPGVDSKVVEHFNQTFTGATEVAWTESATTYEVNFTMNKVKSRVVYDHDGVITKTIRYYDGNGLPLLLFSKLRNKYPNKTVFGVTEISTVEGTSYHIVLEDAKEWVNISADAMGTMRVESKFKKA